MGMLHTSGVGDMVKSRWHEVQSLHALRTGEGPFPTCKGRTQPDCIWISPELACHFRSCSIYDSFADHAAISASFDLQLEGCHLSLVAYAIPNCLDFDRSSGLVALCP